MEKVVIIGEVLWDIFPGGKELSENAFKYLT